MSKITDFISAAIQDKPVRALDAFSSAIEPKIEELLNLRREEIASSLFAEAKHDDEDHDKKKKKEDEDEDESPIEEAEEEDEGDDKGLTDKQKKLPPGLRKAIAKKQANEEKDEDEDEGDEEGLTDKQKKLPPGLRKAIAKKQDKE
jgi:hypothetical protein